MSARLLDGRAVAAELRAEVAAGVEELGRAGARAPGLAAMLVGNDPASAVYVRNKARACEEVGIRSRTLELPAAASESELLALLDRLNEDPEVDGILVQLPLPPGLAADRCLARVRPDKDVDGFHPENVGRLWLGQPGFAPATPGGILELLRRCKIPLQGRHAVIVGRSAIVGKPLAALLLAAHATVTLCHSRTAGLEEHCRRADLLVAAIGRPGFFGPEHVQPGAVVIDVGINRIVDPELLERLFPGDAKRRAGFESRGWALAGDVDFHRVAPRVAAITPVPGGVGPLTVAMLLVNTLTACRRRLGLPVPAAAAP